MCDDVSSHSTRLVHINNELYSEMIAEGLTFVATETRITYKKNAYYDGVRFLEMAKSIVWPPLSNLCQSVEIQYTFDLISTWKFKSPVIIPSYKIIVMLSKYLDHSQRIMSF